jgi:uncharacterized protein
MDAATLRIRLTPRADRNGFVRYEEPVLHARVTAPPVEGAANAALVELLSRTLGIRKGAIIIVSGSTSREKRVEIEGMSQEELEKKIAEALSAGRS